MPETTVIRKAAQDDIDFIINTIIESQKSGTEKISYCNIYSLTEAELRENLENILKEDLEGITGYEFCLSNFLIYEINGERAGAQGSWIEGIDGMPSSIIKTNLLLQFLGREKLEKAYEKFEIIKELNFERDDGAIQLEYFFVKNKFIYKGVFVKLLVAQIKKHMASNKGISKVQSILFSDNAKSYKSFLRIGFEIVEEKTAKNKKILDIYPHDTRILMELKSSEIPNLLVKYQRYFEDIDLRL